MPVLSWSSSGAGVGWVPARTTASVRTQVRERRVARRDCGRPVWLGQMTRGKNPACNRPCVGAFTRLRFGPKLPRTPERDPRTLGRPAVCGLHRSPRR
jgi:hypothetical protein